MSQPKQQSSAEAKKKQEQERQKQKETQEAARKAVEAQNKAKELTQAAAACGDPDERQRLLNEALEKEVEAESFGKTAKYLQSGAFQGLCAGAGLGGGIGVALGTLTGTLVGGTTSVVTGGLGGGLGATVGAAHGPWFSPGKLMGEGLRKVTGDLPGWKATEEQKSALEKMVNGVKEQERPKDDELVQLSEGGGKVAAGKAYTGQREADEGEKGVLQGGRLSMPRIPGVSSKISQEQTKTHSKVQQDPQTNARTARRMEEQYSDFAGQSVTSNAPGSTKDSPRRRPRKLNREGDQEQTTLANGSPKPQTKPSPAKTQSDIKGQSGEVHPTKTAQAQTKKRPKKLEVRSKQATAAAR